MVLGVIFFLRYQNASIAMTSVGSAQVVLYDLHRKVVEEEEVVAVVVVVLNPKHHVMH